LKGEDLAAPCAGPDRDLDDHFERVSSEMGNQLAEFLVVENGRNVLSVRPGRIGVIAGIGRDALGLDGFRKAGTKGVMDVENGSRRKVLFQIDIKLVEHVAGQLLQRTIAQGRAILARAE
jgi:hypothetical protein